MLIDTGNARGSAAVLSGVATVLLTHAHPDHTDPQVFLWRQAAHARSGEVVRPLEVAGPPKALDLCRDWVSPYEPVTWTPLLPGDSAVLASGHRVRALEARHWLGDPYVGPAVLYDVDGRLLAAWDTSPPLPEVPEVPGKAYDFVLLDCNDGLLAQGREHHTLDEFLESVRRLRAQGAVDDLTHVCAVSLGCANPPGPELAAILAQVGASAPYDGANLTSHRP
ncbi:MBL fold metallo-hydrolase [Streptodolium elevatio]